jgi:hypothetical protein
VNRCQVKTTISNPQVASDANCPNASATILSMGQGHATFGDSPVITLQMGFSVGTAGIECHFAPKAV